MGITVSIVSHGHGETVEQLLQQMADLSAPRPERVIVTLNQPEPVLAQGLRGRNWPFDLVLTENAEPLGFGANHNRAFALDAARGASEGFAVVNPDIRLRGNPFGALLAALGSVPHAGLAYPLQVDEGGGRQDHERLLPTPKHLLTRHLGHGAPEVPTGATPDWVNAAFLLLVREAFAQVGGFDERFHMYCEDVDLCLRLRLAGWQLARADGAVVVHAAQRASRRRLSHLGWHVRSLLRLWRSRSWHEFRAGQANGQRVGGTS